MMFMLQMYFVYIYFYDASSLILQLMIFSFSCSCFKGTSYTVTSMMLLVWYFYDASIFMFILQGYSIYRHFYDTSIFMFMLQGYSAALLWWFYFHVHASKVLHLQVLLWCFTSFKDWNNSEYYKATSICMGTSKMFQLF